MIACVVLEVLVQELISGPYDERRSELERAPPRLVLPVALDERLQPGADGGRGHIGGQADGVRLHNFGGNAVLVEEHREWEVLVLNEGLGITLAAGADRGHSDVGSGEVSLSVADLTGSLATGESAEVAEEEQHRRPIRPQVTQPVRIAVRVDQLEVTQGAYIEGHGQTLIRPGWRRAVGRFAALGHR